MKAALDVHYHDESAHAACVTFGSWTDAVPAKTVHVSVPGARPYRPGHFFERELPPLLAILEKVDARLSHIVIDGYVHLKNDGPGLGAHLHRALLSSVAVIGVAKKPFAQADRFEPIFRGRSTKPLFVSAIGCDLDEAAAAVASMHGSYRIPTLLRLADHVARNG